MVSFFLASRARQWYVVGAYMPPNDDPLVHCVDQALKAAPKGVELILLGDLNARLREPCDEREEELIISLADHGLIDITEHCIT